MTRWLTTLCVAGIALFRGSLATAAPTVAYVRYDNGYWQIWKADTNGAHAEAVTRSPWDKRCLRPIPGQKAVLFRDNQGKLYRLSVSEKAEPEPILTDFEVVKDFDYHPRKGYLVSTYAPNAMDNVRIWWINAIGREKQLLIPDPHLNEFPRWTFSDTSFLFVKSHAGRSAVFKASRDGAPPQEFWPGLDVSATDPAPSPRGRWLAFCREGERGMDLWIGKLDGSESRALYRGPGLEADPSWAEDEACVYFSTWDKTCFRIACIRPDGRGLRFLTPEGADCRYPVGLNSGTKEKGVR
jgi:hypothetical protein